MGPTSYQPIAKVAWPFGAERGVLYRQVTPSKEDHNAFAASNFPKLLKESSTRMS